MLTGALPGSQSRPSAQAWGRPIPGLENRHWTADEIKQRLADAGDTLRRLPKPRGLERNLQTAWPDILRDWLAYGWNPTQVKRVAPSPQAISRLDETLSWLHLLTPTQRMVCWARDAEKMTWGRLEYLDRQANLGKGRGHRQLRNIRDDAIARIVNHLNGTPQRARAIALERNRVGGG